MHHGRQIFLGLFTSLEAAEAVRLEAAKRHHGKFASELSRPELTAHGQ